MRKKKTGRKRKPKDLGRLKLLNEIEAYHTELEAQNEELRTSRQEIQDSLDKYSELYDFAPVGIMSLSRNGVIRECNLAAAELLGYSRAFMIDKSFLLFVSPKFHDTCKEFMGKVLSSDSRHSVELDLLGKGRKSIYSQVIGLSMTDPQTQKRQQRIALTDISRQRELIDERSVQLDKVRRELERAQRLIDIGTLAATVAHELRNPLAAMKLATYNVRRKTREARLASHINNIDSKILESEQIINNLVFYARIKIPERESVKIYDLIKSAIQEATKQHPGRAWTLTKDAYVVKNLTVEADAFQIKEAIANILNNACEATDDRTGKILVGAGVADGVLTISVKDNGQGIDERDLPRIFDPFFTTKTKGTGLGLSVARQILMLHGGAINVVSRKGEGTTVKITLPAKGASDVT